MARPIRGDFEISPPRADARARESEREHGRMLAVMPRVYGRVNAAAT